MHRLARLVARGAALVLDALAPRLCTSCGAAADEQGLLCPVCRHDLVPAPSEPLCAGVTLHAPFAYAAPLSEALHALKYAERADLAAPLARLIEPHVASALDECDVLVPVPVHPLRLAERGYNQAALLARALAPRGVRVRSRVLVRTRHDAHQVGLTRDRRAKSVLGAFRVVDGAGVAGARVAIVDDVVTTGATTLSCIETLRDCGARVCAVIAVARTLPSPHAQPNGRGRVRPDM